jgi:integration host factor subunit beta
MLKSDLLNVLVAKKGITQKQAEATIETIFGSMKEALVRGENIEIRGLGAFHVKQYGPYQGRNPKTGEPIAVKAKRGVLFRQGKELKERVNRPGPDGKVPPLPGSTANPNTTLGSGTSSGSGTPSGG